MTSAVGLENLISLRPGGGSGANPLAAFAQGAGAKTQQQPKAVGPSSGASAHQQAVSDRKKELNVDKLQYTASFMLQFSERNTRAPAGLQTVRGLILDEVTKAATQNIAGSANNADPAIAASAGDAAASWRPKQAANAGSAASAASAAGGSTAARAAAAALPDIEIQRAEDIGRTKWEKSKDLTTSEQGKQKLRGILNKLTPDNFEKLVPQVLGIMSVSADMLRVCIPLIFEKAVAEPTFCVLYADLCAVLTRELDAAPTFGTEDGRQVTFKRELLNTCQDQFEGMEQQRAGLASNPLDETAKYKLRMRELGTVRLLGELFNKELVTPAVIKIVVSELVKRGCQDGQFDPDVIEAVVQALTIAGSKMSANEKLAPQLKKWLGQLAKWSDDTALEPRVRFKIKDLLDLVKADWQARRATNTVQKTEDVRKQAHAELGMVNTAVPDFLPGLAIGNAATQAAKEDDSVLFPGMADLRSERANGGATDTSVEADSAAKPKGTLSDEDVTKKAQGTFAEFLSIRDYKEAEACIAELHCNEAQEALVVTAALQTCFDAQKEADREQIFKVLMHLADAKLLSAGGLRQGFQEQTRNLEDLAMDVPLSPMILGAALAATMATGTLPLASLEGLLEGVESAEPKRKLAATLLPRLKAELGEDGATAMIKDAGVSVGVLLDADKDIDPGLPSVFDWAKFNGLEWVPL